MNPTLAANIADILAGPRDTDEFIADAFNVARTEGIEPGDLLVSAAAGRMEGSL